MKSRSKVSASVEEAEWVRNLALRTSLKAVCIDMMLTPVTIASFIARVPQRAGTVDLIQSIVFEAGHRDGSPLDESIWDDSEMATEEEAEFLRGRLDTIAVRPYSESLGIYPERLATFMARLPMRHDIIEEMRCIVRREKEKAARAAAR